MKRILVIGAGRSSSTMIKYFLNQSQKENWLIRVGDMQLSFAQEKVGNHVNGEAFKFNALNAEERRKEISNSDIVISMLPARFHLEVVRDCIDLKKDVITPSYVTDEMKALNKELL